jgi:GTPase SAR1 family protein
MGASISKMMNKIFGSKEMRLLMLGLDAAGKTSTHQSPSHALSSLSVTRVSSTD